MGSHKFGSSVQMQKPQEVKQGGQGEVFKDTEGIQLLKCN